MVPLNSIDDKDISIENNDINFHTFYTPYRNEDDDYNKNNTGFNGNKQNNNSNNTSKTSSDYKKYKSLNNLSSLYPLPYASPILFKSKTRSIGGNSSNNYNNNNNNNNNIIYSSELNGVQIKIPLSSEYWRSRLKRRDLLSTLQPLLID